MEKWFCGCEFVSARNAAPCSSSARIVIADSVIAAAPAAIKPAGASGAAPIAGINRVPKDDSIIATVRSSTENAARNGA